MREQLRTFPEALLCLLLFASAGGCSAQSITEPVVVVVGDNDFVLRGTTTSSVFGGSFSVSNGLLTCSGNFDPHNTAPTISMPTHCSDGRWGTVISNRDPGGNSGSGTVTFSDGKNAVFYFGPGAEALAEIRISSIQSSREQRASAQPISIPSPTPAVVPAPPLPGSTKYVAMKNVRGIYTVPVLINDAITLDFVVDSGAADVTIPADVVSTLMRTGTIQGSDFLGRETYVLANGSKLPSVRFRIRSLKVGDWVLRNVTGSVGDARGMLLLGQSFLEQFSSWSIDNSRHRLVLN